MSNALSDVSFWFDSIGDLPPPTSHLYRDRLDVAIVGAGYTGLWTAYYLKQREPGLRIGIFEAERVGFGASGRNGGWCMGMAWGVEPLLHDPATRSRGVDACARLVRYGRRSRPRLSGREHRRALRERRHAQRRDHSVPGAAPEAPPRTPVSRRVQRDRLPLAAASTSRARGSR